MVVPKFDNKNQKCFFSFLQFLQFLCLLLTKRKNVARIATAQFLLIRFWFLLQKVMSIYSTEVWEIGAYSAIHTDKFIFFLLLFLKAIRIIFKNFILWCKSFLKQLILLITHNFVCLFYLFCGNLINTDYNWYPFSYNLKYSCRQTEFQLDFMLICVYSL